MTSLIKYLFPLIILVSCQTDNTETKPAATASENISFFPVTIYINGQIALIKESGISPVKKTIRGTKTDSVWLKQEELADAFKEFVTPVIDSNNLIQYFNESKFADQTINNYTFTYTPKPDLPDSFSLKRWDVYIDPESNMVKQIFMVKKISPVKELQLTWYNAEYCKIISIITDAAGEQSVEYEELIKWKFD